MFAKCVDIAVRLKIKKKKAVFLSGEAIEAPLNASITWVEAEIEVGHSYLVPLNRDMNQSRMQHFLDCCSYFSAMVGRELSVSQPVRAFVRGEVLLCLPC